jgi:hypothetical protein
MAQKGSDDWKASPTCNCNAGEAMPQVMKANISEPSLLSNALPDLWRAFLMASASESREDMVIPRDAFLIV